MQMPALLRLAILESQAILKEGALAALFSDEQVQEKYNEEFDDCGACDLIGRVFRHAKHSQFRRQHGRHGCIGIRHARHE
jgi:hypothetical protein